MIHARARAVFLALILAAAAAPSRAAAGASTREIPAWGSAVTQAATMVRVSPALAAGMPALSPMLGRLSLELSLQPRSAAAVSFVSRLPAVAASPAAFAALPLERRLSLLHAAVAAESAALTERAAALEARAKEGPLTQEERTELQGIAERWFYLDDAAAQSVQEAAAQARADATMGRAHAIAADLEPLKEEKPAAVVNAALAQAFEGAAELAARDRRAPREGLVEQSLAPYMARALDDAEARAQERGVAAGQVYATLLGAHTQVFGKVADRSLFKALRARGEWTEFAAAASLHAADQLNAQADAHQLLAKVAETDDLRLAIPAWHPLYGKYPSIAHWLAEVHGKPKDDSKGRRLFTAFGIPVKADRTLIPALAVGAYQMTQLFASAAKGRVAGAPLWAMGLAVVVLLYASVVAHEFGHALSARAFGIRTRHIVLNWLGGGAAVVRGFRQALPEFVIALAGPAVSAVCGGLLMLGAHAAAGTLAAPVLLLAGSLNLMLALYNLMPLFPMDGARVLRAGLTRLLGSYRATRATGFLSLGLSALLAADGLMMFAAHQPGGLMRAGFGLFFMFASKAMAVHPGTVTIDERPAKKG